MKIEYKQAIYIENVGSFTYQDSWNGFSKYTNENDDFIITFKGESFFESLFSDDKTIQIIAASSKVTQKLKDIKNEMGK